MRSSYALLILVLAALPAIGAEDDNKWTTIKGQVVIPDAAPIPARKPIVATKDQEVAAKDKDFNSEEIIVSAKSRGIKNVVVWLAPEPTAAEMASLKSGKLKDFPSFKAADVNPILAKPEKSYVEIDQPCCRFLPHYVLAREGQDMRIKNSAPIPHNAKWVSRKNGDINPLLPSLSEHVIKNLQAEKFPIEISCSIHPWMKAWVRVFDHPYFALSDEDGKFEIKLAPSAKPLRLFVFHESAGFNGGSAGRFGQVITVKPMTADLGKIVYEGSK